MGEFEINYLLVRIDNHICVKSKISLADLFSLQAVERLVYLADFHLISIRESNKVSSALFNLSSSGLNPSPVFISYKTCMTEKRSRKRVDYKILHNTGAITYRDSTEGVDFANSGMEIANLNLCREEISDYFSEHSLNDVKNADDLKSFIADISGLRRAYRISISALEVKLGSEKFEKEYSDSNELNEQVSKYILQANECIKLARESGIRETADEKLRLEAKAADEKLRLEARLEAKAHDEMKESRDEKLRL